MKMANGWKTEHFSAGGSSPRPFHPDEQSTCLGLNQHEKESILSTGICKKENLWQHPDCVDIKSQALTCNSSNKSE